MKNDTIIWDKSNIGENYPGITLPFTYSFLKNAYAQVYFHFLSRLGVNQKTLAANRSVFDNMIGSLNGNIYYNLSNWYELLKFLPGYDFNRQFFETMLEPAKKGGGKNKTKLQPALLWQNRAVFLNFCTSILFFAPLKKEFRRRFSLLNQSFEKIDLSQQTPVELVTLFLNLQNRFFNLWAITIINDFRVMIFFGVLNAFVRKNMLNPDKALQQLHHLKKQPTSLEPLNQLRHIALTIKNNPGYAQLFSQDPSDILEKIHTPTFAGLNSLLTFYLETFGHRFENELKLESKTFKQDPLKIIVLLKKYSQSTSSAAFSRQKLSLRVKKSPQAIYRYFYHWLLSRTINAIHDREHFRLKRAQAFNIARSLTLEMGQRLVEWGDLKSKDDIFYLYADEVFDYLRFHRHPENFQARVHQRQRLYETYQKSTLPRRLVTKNGPNQVAAPHPSKPKSVTYFSGMTTSPGNSLTAPIIVQKQLDLSADFKGKILVANATDPGWTVIFPLVKAVVTEYGGMLSHASIVARELGMPCIVKAAGITQLKTGDIVKLDPQSGTITLVS